MNRRQLLTAIPAAVAALTASKARAGATSPLDASAAIVGQPDSVFPIRAGEKLRVVVSDDHSVFNVYTVPGISEEEASALWKEALGYTVPRMTYVAPTSEIEQLTATIWELVDALGGE